MELRTWAFCGAVAAGAALAAFAVGPEARAARRGANLIARVDGKVVKAKRRTISGTFTPATGEFLLGSADIRVHPRTESVNVRVLSVGFVQTGIEDATPRAPVTIADATVLYAAGYDLAPGSGVGDAVAWAGTGEAVQLTITSFRLLSRPDADGNSVARVSGTFSGTLTAVEEETTPQTVTVTKGRFQANVVLLETPE